MSSTKKYLFSILIVISATTMAFVFMIARVYRYNTLSTTESVIGFIFLLAVTGFVWLYRHLSDSRKDLVDVERAIWVGIALGLLWMIEIGINNFIAPPLPARDIIDNIFWFVIAFSMLIFIIMQAFRTNRVAQGIKVGLWSGFASGLLACATALLLIVFGMKWLMQDPLNLAEWSERGASSQAPTMAAYFAYETFAGAFVHLIILGIAMGGLLGIIGGVIGKSFKWFLHFLHRSG